MGIIITNVAGNMSIINHHAPSNDKKPEEKENHWDSLAALNRCMPRKNIKITMGDANVRWGGRREEEKDILEETIFGKGEEKIIETSNSISNREFAIEYLRSQK